jgi:hypothetical protein
MTADSEASSASIVAEGEVVENSREDNHTLYVRDSPCPSVKLDQDLDLEGGKIGPVPQGDGASFLTIEKAEKRSTPGSDSTIYVSPSIHIARDYPSP